MLMDLFLMDSQEQKAKQMHYDLLLKYNSSISAMIALEVADKVLIERLLERGKKSGRADDSNKSIIENRIKEYYTVKQQS